MGRTIFAIFDDFPTAQRVAATLERDGFDASRMSVLVPKSPVPGLSSRLKPGAQPDKTGPGGSGALQDVAVPGVGLVAAAGPLMGVCSESNTDPGGLVASLVRLGFSDAAARHYYESLRRRQVMIAVEAPGSRARNAVELMRRFGARAVEETASVEAPPDPAPPPSTGDAVVDHVTVPVVEEQLDVRKRQVTRGGIRINSQIVEQPIQEQIQLREERVSVQRRPVSREATEADLAAFKEGSIEIHETVEEPVISKRKRVVEEVIIGRETRERTQSISETVRKTQVHVEPLTPPGEPAGPSSEPPEPYDPAYSYGSALAHDNRYRNAEWSEIEQQAKLGWEDRHGGTWEQFKDAVRTAWAKVNGR